MNPAPEVDPLKREFAAKSPANWREALLTLVASRLALIELEAKEAATRAIRRAIFIGGGACCICVTWALLLAGGIAGLAEITGWPWYWIAIAIAALHLGAAVVLVRAAGQILSAPSFPVTRAEFKNDREWIENLNKTRKSDG